jgi:hypothetical protein
LSVSLALIPVALTLRVVMGKEGFENWVRSMQVRMPTTFEHEVDLVVSVRKAGYDAEKWGGLIKTHVRGEQEFLFWELVDGTWTAIFAKSDSQETISRFVRDLEDKTGRKIFATEQGPNSVATPQRQTFPTNFRDGELLASTLRDHGLQPTAGPGGEVTCRVEQSTLRFRPAEEGPFSVEVDNAPNLQPVFGFLSTLDEDYKRGVQAAAYEGLMSRVEEKNLTVESEEVLEDNSIVITLNVRE